MLRDSSTREDASSRLNSQFPIAKKVEYADLVIDNSGSRAELNTQVEAFIHKINNSISKPRWLLSWFIPPVGVALALWSILFSVSRRKLKRS